MEPDGGVSVTVSGTGGGLSVLTAVWLFQVQPVEPGGGLSVGAGRAAGLGSLQPLQRGDDVSPAPDAAQRRDHGKERGSSVPSRLSPLFLFADFANFNVDDPSLCACLFVCVTVCVSQGSFRSGKTGKVRENQKTFSSH